MSLSLKESYQRIMEMVDNPESFEVVEQIETYRNLWKPVQVNVILLAESHVYTSQEDFLEWSYGENPAYRGRLVRFVYCLGYGENLVKISSNPGTPQFWKILYSCLHRVQGKRDFAPILKSLTRDKDQRIANKIALLEELKRAGVWLVDASIMGINGRDPNLKSGIVEASWDAYTGPLIEGLDPRPRDIIIVGYGVAKTLQSRLNLSNIPTHEIPQPQGWRKPGYAQFYRECFDTCSKFA